MLKNHGIVDRIGLSRFVIATSSKKNWGYAPDTKDAEMKAVVRRVKALQEKAKLRGEDMVGTFIAHRVLPLQMRAHKICHMGGRLDATRTSTFVLSNDEILSRVKGITKLPGKMKEWSWGKRAFCRASPPPIVCYLTL